jgi:tRNA/tmRNA/rRNA uracil-C5-methylase (TrmA/RlmC/RlmD family)
MPERTTRFRVGANNKSGFRNRSMNLVTGNSSYLAIVGFMQLRSKKHIPVTNLQML